MGERRPVDTRADSVWMSHVVKRAPDEENEENSSVSAALSVQLSFSAVCARLSCRVISKFHEMSPVEHLAVELVGAEHYDECVDFIYQHFFPRERLAIASGLDQRPFHGARALYKKWLGQQVSLMVYDRSTGRLAALCLNFLVDKDQEVPVDCLSMPRENRVIWDFLDSLESGYDVFQNMGSSQGLELLFLCVRDEYTGRGLAGKLTEETIRLARRRGCGFVKSNPTTAATYKVFQKCGFQLIKSMKLTDFIDGDEPPFPHADADDSAGFVVMKLSKTFDPLDLRVESDS